jgi:hypothetical protein
MKNIALEVTRCVDLHILVYKNDAALVRAWRERSEHDAPTATESPEAFFYAQYFGVRLDVAICLSDECDDLDAAIVHEAHHAADAIWRAIRKRKAYRGVVPSEMRAYITQDIVTVFRNWKKLGYRPDVSILEGLVLPNVSKDWEGVKRTRKPKQRNEMKNS